MSNMNEILCEIVSIACKARLADEESVKLKAMGDIVDALASVIPAERVYRTPKHIVDFIDETCNVPFADQADPAFLKKFSEKFKLVEKTDAPEGYAKFLTVAPGVKLVRFKGKDVVRLLARRKGNDPSQNAIFEIEVVPEEKVAYVSRNDRLLFKIFGESVNSSHLEHIAISSLHRFLKDVKACNERRHRARKAKKAAARAEREAAAEAETADAVRREADAEEASTAARTGSAPYQADEHAPVTAEDLENA